MLEFDHQVIPEASSRLGVCPPQRDTGGAERWQNARRGVVVIGRRTAEKVNRYFTMEELGFLRHGLQPQP